MHHLTCGISSLLHSVNVIVFTLLLVHLILRISPHHSQHIRYHHLLLPRPFTPDLKLISFTNPFIHSLSLSGSFWTVFTDLEPVYRTVCTGVCFSFFLYFLPARRYASASNSDRNVSVRPSVRPSVCHTPVLCQNEES